MLPALADLLATARVVSLPLRGRFRGIIERELLLFEGPLGCTEWSPFTEYETAEAATWLRAAIEFGFGAVERGAQAPMVRTRIPVNATLAAVTPAEVETVLERFGKFETVKIKVAESGQCLSDDLARIRRVHELYPNAKLRLDANGGWRVAEVLAVAGALSEAGFNLDYLEQPVASLTEMIELRERLDQMGLATVRLAADELVRKAEDPLAIARTGAVDVLVLKVQPLGGVAAALDLAEAAKAASPRQLSFAVSSAIESSVGISMGLALAGALPELEHDCGLATVHVLAADVTDEPLEAKDGFLDVRRVAVSSSKLQKYAANPERTEWWLRRLEACYRELEG